MNSKAVSGMLSTFLLTSILTLAFNIQPVRTEPTTITVPDDYLTIEEAVDAASPGDTIYVKAGIYYEEQVTIEKPLELVGEDKDTTFIDGAESWICVYIKYTNDVKISEFTIQNGYGIYLYNSENVTISGNIISDNGQGIIVIGSNNNAISKNIFTRNHVPILLDGSSNNRISFNIVTLNEWGAIWLENSHGNSISRNTVSKNGLNLNESCHARGLRLDSSNNNIIHHNNIIDNHEQAVCWNSVNNRWDNGYPSGGNYWSDYDGGDIENGPSQDMPGSDGIGDTPYIIETSAQDRYPLVNPLGSPPPPTHTLTINATDNGTTKPPPGTYTYSEEQNVSVQAIPNTGYVLDYWELDGVNIGSFNPVNVTMNTNHNLCAIFTYDVTIVAYCYFEGRNVSVSIWMDGSPTIYTTPHTFTNLTGTHIFTVPSVDANGHPFKQWNTSQVDTTITVNSGGTYTAYYDMKYILTITTTTGGITDPTPGTYTYWSGSIVSVTAIPEAECYLDYWELDGVNIGSFNPVYVYMEANHTLHTAFAQFGSGHNIAVKGLSTKSVVGQGFPSTIEAFIMNVGGYTETFNVTVYANATIIQTLTVYNLTSRNSTTVTFTWDTTSFAKGNYTITATATPVPEETSTADNTLTDCWVIVTIPGDVNGDHKVNVKDIFAVAKAFGSYPGHPRWDPNMDINQDLIINVKDLFAVAKNFGKENP
jgi:parallel beta-helix repeat protein